MVLCVSAWQQTSRTWSLVVRVTSSSFPHTSAVLMRQGFGPSRLRVLGASRTVGRHTVDGVVDGGSGVGVNDRSG